MFTGSFLYENGVAIGLLACCDIIYSNSHMNGLIMVRLLFKNIGKSLSRAFVCLASSKDRVHWELLVRERSGDGVAGSCA